MSTLSSQALSPIATKLADAQIITDTSKRDLPDSQDIDRVVPQAPQNLKENHFLRNGHSDDIYQSSG